MLEAVASQPINEGGQSPGAPKVQGAPVATCKNLCHEMQNLVILLSGKSLNLLPPGVRF